MRRAILGKQAVNSNAQFGAVFRATNALRVSARLAAVFEALIFPGRKSGLILLDWCFSEGAHRKPACL
jgi:hypothetical protein